METETKTKKNTTKKTPTVISMKAIIYDEKGNKSGEINLPKEVFGLSWNSDLVHQVVVAQQSNSRIPIAHTKDRSEVRGGGRKPWRQKGTGRARHGSTRSPIWKGGGVTFGPRNDKNYTKKINKKMKTKALFTVLSKKLKEGEIVFIDNISTKEPKTTKAKEILSAISKVKGLEFVYNKKNNSALILLNDKDLVTAKSFRNFGNVEVDEVRNINPVSALTYKHIIITKPKDAISFFESKLSDSKKQTKKQLTK